MVILPVTVNECRWALRSVTDRLIMACTNSSLIAKAKSSSSARNTLLTEAGSGGPDGFPPGRSINMANAGPSARVLNFRLRMLLPGRGVVEGSKLLCSEFTNALLMAESWAGSESQAGLTQLGTKFTLPDFPARRTSMAAPAGEETFLTVMLV